jgi:hypothetical protein
LTAITIEIWAEQILPGSKRDMPAIGEDKRKPLD